MVAQQLNLDVIANNLSNVSTTGFKSQRAEFQDMLYETWATSGAPTGGTATRPTPQQVGLGARFNGITSNFQAGGFQNTGDPLNMAINGQGFFQILLPDGSTGYTRDGSFKQNAAGQVVTSDGHVLQPEITIPTGLQGLHISSGGQVSGILAGETSPQEIGQIQLVGFPNPAGLTRIGMNLYRAGGNSGEPTVANAGTEGLGQISPGMVEGSNVQVVEEMVHMILAQRAYEINSKAIQTADDMLSVLNGLKR